MVLLCAANFILGFSECQEDIYQTACRQVFVNVHHHKMSSLKLLNALGSPVLSCSGAMGPGDPHCMIKCSSSGSWRGKRIYLPLPQVKPQLSLWSSQIRASYITGMKPSIMLGLPARGLGYSRGLLCQSYLPFCSHPQTYSAGLQHALPSPSPTPCAAQHHLTCASQSWDGMRHCRFSSNQIGSSCSFRRLWHFLCGSI